MRNQIRHHIFNHDFLTDKEYHHFLNFCNEVSDLKRDTSNYYDLLIEKYQISKRSISLNVFSNSISYRNFIRHFLVKNGILQINTNLVGECSKLLHNPNKPQGLVQISSSLIFFKEYDHFGLKSAEQKETGVVPTFKFNQWFKVGNDELGIFELPLADSYKYQKKIPIVYSTQDPPFCWRYREPGDLIMIGDHRKKLRRFLIEKKVPKSKRDRLLILASGSKVLFLEKFGYSGLFNISKTDKITSVVLLR
ncbi:tRNA lysidine(34) synthetase TilS [Xylocopilactobacillus apicola]|uniref:Lysidine-tRNA(Ile) synthetase C-terminal domain-containing protein n=1 Tax=Xylocopilactobacillus apicola TaxID=2932184 RepID=A0AAU9DIT4_9LACO|nr:tRNA lysidine(34) synthetase TilS [Xylocopilactobacillus apicola]BDR58336.1 hypothetical protein XA3_07770 [Xylocopilactobacillus apicola]